jgi:hypothetical protein
MVVPRRQDNGIMRRIPSLLSSTTMRLMVVAIAFPFTSSQTIGVDICACSPSVYTFELSFLLNCSMETVKDNPGVKDAECRVSGLRPEDNVTDLVPVKVSTVEILELGAEQQVIQSGFYDQGYFDLATISYTSITGNPDALNLTVDQIPRGLQINIIGQNANEEDILNYWIVLFTNQCNAFPVFEIGDMIGWTVIVRIVTSLFFDEWSLWTWTLILCDALFVFAAWPGQPISILLPTGIGGSDVFAGTVCHCHAFTHRITNIDPTNSLCTERRCALHFDRSGFITNDGALVLPSTSWQG